MKVNDIIKFWNLDKETIINRNLPKVQIYSALNKTKDKEFIQKTIQSIYLIANYKPENTRIPLYESDFESYQEIQFMHIKVRKDNSEKNVFKILSEIIPYPLISIIQNNEQFVIMTGRYEKLSNGYLRLIQSYSSPIYSTDEIENVLSIYNLNNYKKYNLKLFYDDLRDDISTQTIREEYDKEVQISSEEKDKLDSIKKEINILSNKISKERQLNKKIELQVKLKKSKDELEMIINRNEERTRNE